MIHEFKTYYEHYRYKVACAKQLDRFDIMPMTSFKTT